MVKHPTDVPITYLNKGQTYQVSVHALPLPSSPTATVCYRIHVRVTFDAPEQRARPSAAWQLWKEGRGTVEAPQRGDRLQAVETTDGGDTFQADDASVLLDSTEVDGFSVIWLPAGPFSDICSIPLRLNFLSTDFSHAKGVKGVPVRLCVKVETLSQHLVESGAANVGIGRPEMVYCKIKLFRDHGAERKLSNDVAHVKKSVDRLRRLENETTGAGVVERTGKRKRSPHGASAENIEKSNSVSSVASI